MKFVFSSPGRITCIPESETELYGFSSASKKKIKLIYFDLCFDRRMASQPNGDHLALVCWLAFYPLIANLADSNARGRLFFQWSGIDQLKWQKVIDLFGWSGKLMIQSSPSSSIDKPSIIEHGKVALSWGGGLDSWGCYLLNPDWYHYRIKQVDDMSIQDDTCLGDDGVLKIGCNLRKIYQEVGREDRQVGWPVWVGVLVGLVWVAQDLGLQTLVVGGNLGSVFLAGGKKFSPGVLKGQDRWGKLFSLFGLDLVYPLAGLSDLAVARLVRRELGTAKLVKMIEDGEIKYCGIWNDGRSRGNCGSCLKCFRREVLLGLKELDDRSGKWLNRIDGPSFEFLRSGGLSASQWIWKYYRPGLELVKDSQVKLMIKNQLALKGVEFLSRESQYLVEHYGWI